MSELPPNSKKLSSPLTASLLSTSRQRPASDSSVGDSGRLSLLNATFSIAGDGKRARSSFPLGFKGNSGTTIKCAGIM